VIKFRRREIVHQSPDDFKTIDQSTVAEAEQKYQKLIFLKEETEMQQNEEMQQKDLEIEEMLEKVRLLEDELTDTRRFGSNLDLEVLRLEDRGYRQGAFSEVRAVVDSVRIRKARNLRLTGV
jgi:hypothetical protein